MFIYFKPEVKLQHSYKLTLPFPVSTNTYWRHVGRYVKISEKGRLFRQAVSDSILCRKPPINTHVSVQVYLYPPDRRRRDIDNYAGKSLLDALVYAGVLEDDSLIVELKARKMPFSQENKNFCKVLISAVDNWNEWLYL